MNQRTFFQKSILSKPNKSVLPPKSMLLSSTNRTSPAGVVGTTTQNLQGRQVVSCSWSTIAFLLCQSTHSQKIGGFPTYPKVNFTLNRKCMLAPVLKQGRLLQKVSTTQPIFCYFGILVKYNVVFTFENDRLTKQQTPDRQGKNKVV